MISVNTFVRHSSVWSQAMPALDHVVKWANEERRALGKPVPTNSIAERHALISEIAFLLAKYDSSAVPKDPNEIEAEARAFLTRMPRAEANGPHMSEEEWAEAHALFGETSRYTHWLPGARFSPVVPGCGVVDCGVADVLAGSELIEIKAVLRPFRSADFRQVLTYVAMFYSAGVLFDKVTLLNPRLSHVVTLSIDELAATGAGKSRVELLQELVEWMVGLQVSA